MKRYFATLLGCLALLSCPIAARPAARQGQPGGGFGWFGPTLAFVDFNGMNSELGQVGVDVLNSAHWQFGGGGHFYTNRVVIGGSGQGGSQTVALDSLVVRVDIGGGRFEAGYAVLTLKHLVVTPILGIGGSAYSVTVESRRAPSSFRELLTEPGPSSTVEFSGIGLTPLLQVTMPISFVGVQLRGGYALMPMNPAWKFPNGGSLPRGPGVARGYPFASLNVALGGFGFTSRRTGSQD
ncbi:MAG: hypothetical protein R6X12_10160 [bacterium]